MIKQPFHVVLDDFAIPSSGIIGKDVLKLYKCNIDYEHMTLTIQTDTFGNDTVPIQPGVSENEVNSPPRSEVFTFYSQMSKFSSSHTIK